MSEGLKPRIIDGMQAEYEVSIYPGTNTSGLIVFGKNVLVKMDNCSKTTAGGVHLLDEMRERMDMASTTGAIFALGSEAFRRFDDGTIWTGPAPQLGDRVYVVKYSGVLAMGKDGSTYRIMDYSNIVGGLDPDEIGFTQDTAA